MTGISAGRNTADLSVKRDMHIQVIIEKDQQVYDLVSKKRVKNALEVLSEMVVMSKQADYRSQIEDLQETYENMLKYTIEGIRDPERQRIYNHLLLSILLLSQETRENVLAGESGWHTYWLKKEIEKEQRLTGHTIVEKMEDLTFKKELDQILKEDMSLHEEAYKARTKKHRELQEKIFHHLWLTDRYRDAEAELLTTILNRDHFTWYERSIFTSAVTLSLLRFFDENKLFALFKFLETEEEQVWQRALVGLILGLYRYDKWLPFLPKVEKRLEALAERKGIKKDVEMIILQIIRSKDTEKISQRLQEEIIPEMAKLKPNLQDKLDLDNLVAEDFLEDKNPKWEKVFGESEGFYSKMEEFSKLQLEGADVFMSAFAMLKHFDFFRDISHWFLPFYPENDLIDEALSQEDPSFDKHAFIDGLFNTGFLCNSDKYSFCLNIRQMPQMQKSLLLKLFAAEMEGMNEMAADEEVIDTDRRSRTYFRQYIQDLYRFFKLFPNKREFHDIFRGRLDLYHSHFFRKLVDDHTISKNIADYFLDKDHYEEALEIYLNLYEKKINESAEIIEKIAFCFQKLGRYRQALDYYRKAELFDTNKLWSLKKIGTCYRYLKQPSDALTYYLEAEKLDPDNLFIQTSIGRCYLDLEDYEKALQRYFRVEYLDPGNTKVLRPIAWCYFAQGNLKQSAKYFEKLFETPVTKYDYINRGHVEWCMGNRKQAVEYYRMAILKGKININEFVQIYWDDREYLTINGMDPEELPIILDYLQFQLK